MKGMMNVNTANGPMPVDKTAIDVRPTIAMHSHPLLHFPLVLRQHLAAVWMYRAI
jgi:hypothetical protein